METSKGTVYYKGTPEAPVGRVSWPAIFAGTLIMLITLMLLSLLGVGIGLG
ncbi:MAG: PhnA-like protein, partial [Verrucomicrobia bacterium]|nr:PhnA-like protein [Prolixibacteraceae bacterium]